MPGNAYYRQCLIKVINMNNNNMDRRNFIGRLGSGALVGSGLAGLLNGLTPAAAEASDDYYFPQNMDPNDFETAITKLRAKPENRADFIHTPLGYTSFTMLSDGLSIGAGIGVNGSGYGYTIFDEGITGRVYHGRQTMDSGEGLDTSIILENGNERVEICFRPDPTLGAYYQSFPLGA